MSLTCNVVDWIDGISYGAGVFARQPWQSIVIAQGLVSANDFSVSAQSTPNMSVAVGAGEAFIQGTLSADQGVYFVRLDTGGTVDIAAANSSPRIDLIVVQVTDTTQGQSGTSGAAVVAVTGTASSTPSPPPVPANSLVLAQVAVAANATSITSSDISYAASQAVLRNSALVVFSGGSQPYPLDASTTITAQSVTLPYSGLVIASWNLLTILPQWQVWLDLSGNFIFQSGIVGFDGVNMGLGRTVTVMGNAGDSVQWIIENPTSSAGSVGTTDPRYTGLTVSLLPT